MPMRRAPLRGGGSDVPPTARRRCARPSNATRGHETADDRHFQVGRTLRSAPVRVRPFVPNDIPAVASIVREALRENYPTSLYLDIHRWWRDGFLVADLDGHPVGFLAAVISADGQARLLMFAVTAVFRKQGFGSQVMNAFVQACAVRGTRTIELEVRISNEEAIRFYKRYGFEISAVLPKFYTDGEDGFKMVRRLG